MPFARPIPREGMTLRQRVADVQQDPLLAGYLNTGDFSGAFKYAAGTPGGVQTLLDGATLRSYFPQGLSQQQMNDYYAAFAPYQKQMQGQATGQFANPTLTGGSNGALTWGGIDPAAAASANWADAQRLGTLAIPQAAQYMANRERTDATFGNTLGTAAKMAAAMGLIAYGGNALLGTAPEAGATGAAAAPAAGGGAGAVGGGGGGLLGSAGASAGTVGASTLPDIVVTAGGGGGWLTPALEAIGSTGAVGAGMAATGSGGSSIDTISQAVQTPTTGAGGGVATNWGDILKGAVSGYQNGGWGGAISGAVGGAGGTGNSWLDGLVQLGGAVGAYNQAKQGSAGTMNPATTSGSFTGSGTSNTNTSGTTAGTTTGNSSSSTVRNLPPWMQQQYQDTLARINSFASQPYDPYTGDRVAGITGDEANADALQRSSMGLGSADLQYGIDAAKSLAGGLSPDDIKRFYNPFESDVVGATQRDIDYQRQLAEAGASSAASAASAFGGDREAVYKAQLGGDVLRNGANTIANLRKAGYDTATQTALADRTQRLAGIDAINAGVGNLRTANSTDIAALRSQGQTQRAIDQAKLDANYSTYNDRRQFNQQQVQTLLDTIARLPQGLIGDTSTGSVTGSTTGTTSGTTAGQTTGQQIDLSSSLPSTIKQNPWLAALGGFLGAGAQLNPAGGAPASSPSLLPTKETIPGTVGFNPSGGSSGIPGTVGFDTRGSNFDPQTIAMLRSLGLAA